MYGIISTYTCTIKISRSCRPIYRSSYGSYGLRLPTTCLTLRGFLQARQGALSSTLIGGAHENPWWGGGGRVLLYTCHVGLTPTRHT